ncbi:calcium-binding protein [Rhizobium sp. LjRoot254]|uniref:calcium-binding protein n=1 Tax=Rhizobium sp. LjRoot254 TaxID=3342297 RepID=UPI003ED16A83
MPTPTFSGASYQLNPFSPNDNQNSPAVAALDDGRFVTVYRGDDLNPGMLRYVIHNADGTLAHLATLVDIAALKGGGFAITWSQRSGNDENVYHRVYGADGEPVTGPILTNADETDGTAKRPDIVGDGEGGFYIVWDDSAFDNDPGPGQTFTRAVRYQHFGADGQPLGPSQMLSDAWGADSNAAIAISRDGSRLNVIWDDDLGQSRETNNTDGIYGTEIGGDGFYRADKGTFSEFQTDPDVAYSTGTTFMAVWNEFLSPGTYAVYGSINGGAEFQINTSSHTHFATMQKVVGLKDGNFLVVWYDGGFGGNDDVLGQLISSTGAKIGTEFVISDRTSTDIIRITASEMIDGRVIVTWGSSDGPSEVYGRIVDPRQGSVEWTGDESGEQFTGTSFADTLDGGQGDDVIQGLDGADVLIGGDGNDTASYDLSTTGLLANLAKATDNLGGALGDTFTSIENLSGSRFADTLIGDTGINMLRGLDGNDVMQGGGGDDVLSGGDGDDVLSGDGGSDFLSGGDGADIFLFSNLKDSAPKTGRDTITDFVRNEDDIDIRRIDANEDKRRDQAFDFIGTQKFHKDAGELRYEVKGGDVIVSGDTDGDGKADFSLLLDEIAKLRASDFLL